MPENKDEQTQEELVKHLDFLMNTCEQIAMKFGKEVYPRIKQGCIQLKEIVKEHFGLKNWTCTAKEYYALPEPIRNYIAKLETNADPPSMVRENVLLRDTLKALELRSTVTRTEIENAVGDTSEEYLEGVFELFEEKGFVVEGRT